MTKRRFVIGLGLLFGLCWLATACMAGERPGAVTAPSKLEVVVHYDFFLGNGAKVNDASGKKHAGTLAGGELVEGRRRNAVRLDGTGMIRVDDPKAALSPVARPFTVGAVCNPTAADGVIAALGDRSNGFSLYLKGGVPQFGRRFNGKLTKVVDVEAVPMNQWCHLIGGIDETGEVWLIVNGYGTAHTRGKLIARAPTEPLSIGADPAPVGEYATPTHFKGMLQEVRLYWGFIDLRANREDMKDWADLSGCGCK